MTNKILQKSFNILNKRFFQGRLNGAIVKFGDCGEDGKADGEHTSGEITISSDFKRHPDMALLTLLHEMVHADLDREGYIGYVSDGGHHTRFYAGIDRLYKAGAYEGLL